MLGLLEELIWETGQAILRMDTAQDLRVRHKKDQSPLTEADLLADRMLKAGLERILPLPLVSEESVSPALGAEPERYWLIDPIDGTKEFIAHRPTYTVNIALIEAGKPVLGVVYAPSLGELYSGTREDGLRLNGRSLSALHWPEKKTLVCSLSHSEAELDAFALREGINERIAIGSSYKFCLVARGKAHCYPRFRSLSSWDIAAGHAVAMAAGCQVLSWEGRQPLHYSYGQKEMPPFVVLAPDFKLQQP